MGSSSPFGSLTASALIHSSCVCALLVAPDLIPLDLVPMNLGSEPPTQIEFEALPPKGEPQAPIQVEEIAEVTQSPIVKAKAAPPAPAAKPTPVKAATVLPEKEIIEELPVETVDLEDAVPVVVAQPELNDAIDETSIEEVAENFDEPIGDELLAEKVEEFEETEAPAAEEVQAAEAQPEALVKEPAAVATSAPRGVSNGVRSYESLSQVPGNIPPQYPSRARLQRQQGQVILKYFVTSEGQVDSLQMVQSSGFPLLDKEAVDSIRQFRYRPGQEGWTLHPVDFTLRGPEQKVGGRLRTSMR